VAGCPSRGPDGESLSFGASSDVPDAIADVVDVPDGFEPTNVVEHSEGERMSTTVVGTVDTADPVALIEGIEAGLADDGWEREGFSNTNNQMVLVAMSRGEDENLNVTVLTDDARRCSPSSTCDRPDPVGGSRRGMPAGAWGAPAGLVAPG
jgi:hypothetical protein